MARVCAKPGCPEIAVDKKHCNAHKREPPPFQRQRDPKAAREYDKARGNRHRRGYNSKWDKARKGFLKQYPTCQHPECSEPSTDVDHIKPWRDGDKKDWKAFWDRKNWQALCSRHHGMKTYSERLGRKRYN